MGYVSLRKTSHLKNQRTIEPTEKYYSIQIESTLNILKKTLIYEI